ncbi:collagen alpha-1(I) chain-like isoform X1 [Ailuropoda melanoleuca]|uniref:collagen alpha-1(I) chain-like isoform X1 n=1 Tax=Ailuropoda melanoleuca TaxID=9646 RepID=UPI001494793C|nr:collagen alpha-1(I) chain-like isoform X1 [Ailuropoda melanoleuca]
MFCGRGRAVVSVLAGRTGQVQAREADFSSVQRNRLSIGAAQPDPTDRAGFPFFPLLDRHADAEQELSQVTRWSLAVGSCRNVIAFPIFLPRSSSPPFRSPGAFAVRPHGGGFAGGGLSAPRVCPATVTSRPRRRELVAGASGGRRRGGGIRGRRPERVPGLPGNSDVTAPPPRIGSRSLWGRRRGGGMAGPGTKVHPCSRRPLPPLPAPASPGDRGARRRRSSVLVELHRPACSRRGRAALPHGDAGSPCKGAGAPAANKPGTAQGSSECKLGAKSGALDFGSGPALRVLKASPVLGSALSGESS